MTKCNIINKALTTERHRYSFIYPSHTRAHQHFSLVIEQLFRIEF